MLLQSALTERVVAIRFLCTNMKEYFPPIILSKIIIRQIPSSTNMRVQMILKQKQTTKCTISPRTNFNQAMLFLFRGKVDLWSGGCFLKTIVFSQNVFSNILPPPREMLLNISTLNKAAISCFKTFPNSTTFIQNISHLWRPSRKEISNRGLLDIYDTLNSLTLASRGWQLRM